MLIFIQALCNPDSYVLKAAQARKKGKIQLMQNCASQRAFVLTAADGYMLWGGSVYGQGGSVCGKSSVFYGVSGRE